METNLTEREAVQVNGPRFSSAELELIDIIMASDTPDELINVLMKYADLLRAAQNGGQANEHQ